MRGDAGRCGVMPSCRGGRRGFVLFSVLGVMMYRVGLGFFFGYMCTFEDLRFLGFLYAPC